MNKRVLSCLVVLWLVAGSAQVVAQQFRDEGSVSPTNSLIQQLVGLVSQDSIIAHIRNLQSYGTRYEFTPQRDSAATYIGNTLRRWGYLPDFDLFSYSMVDYLGFGYYSTTNWWIIGQDVRNQQNVLLKTTNAGSAWTVLNAPPVIEPTGIQFINPRLGWVVGAGGIAYKTLDSGTTWTKQSLGTTEKIFDITFADDVIGIAVGTAGTILRTSDAGAHWASIPWGGTANLMKCKSFGPLSFIAVGGAGTILISRDAGLSWSNQSSGTTSDLVSVDFADALTGLAVGALAKLVKTTDGGTTWQGVSLPSTAKRSADLKQQDVAMFSPSTAVVLSAGELWRTTNGGATWLLVASVGSHSLRKLDSQEALTYGGLAGLYRSGTVGLSWSAWDFGVPRSMYSTSRNCTATIPGTITPDREYIIVAHYDGPIGNDPGGDNNGSGVAVALEAMRVLKLKPFESTIRFVATSGKETGLLGSKRYVSVAKSQGRDIRLVVNLDMVGYPLKQDTARFVVGSYLKKSRFVDTTIVANNLYGIGSRLDISVDTLREGDTYPFDINGYEALQISEGTTQEITQNNPYFLKPGDTDDKLSRVMMQKASQLAIALIGGLANPLVTSKTWTWTVPFQRWNDLRAVHVVDASTAFCVGDVGTILKTTNGGTTWTQQLSGTSVSLRGIWMTSASRGVAVGDQGLVLRTTNGGTTWTQRTIASANSGTLYGVSFADANTGTIVGDYGSVYRTTDGGATWSQQIVTPLMTIYSVSYFNKKGIFVGSLGAIFGTTDGGSKWTRLVSGIESVKAPSLLAATYGDVNNGTAVGEFGIILHTTDGGVTWVTQQSGTPFHLRSVSFLDAKIGFAVGDQGVIVGTTDGGTTWTERSEGMTSWFGGIRFANATTGLLVGFDGMLARTTDGGATWTYQVGGPRVPLYAVRFTGLTQGFAAGYQGSIYGTFDGGASWQARVSRTGNELRTMDFSDQYNGIIAGDMGTILRTSDGGATWIDQTILPMIDTTYWFNGVALTSSGFGLLVGRLDSLTIHPPPPWSYATRSVIFRTTKSGRTWSRVFLPWSNELTAVAISNENVATVVGKGIIARTTDGGLTWSRQGTSIPVLTSVSFWGSDLGVAVGDGGVVMRTTNGGTTWTQQVSSTTSSLKGVWTPNGTNFFAVGVGGAIVISNNGGITWTGVATSAVQDLYAIHFSDVDRGTIVGDLGIVLRTVPSGTISIVDDNHRFVTTPSEFSLAQNYPNPFNGMTTIEFQISRTSPVILKLYDLLGREVATLADEVKGAGSYRLRWDSKYLASGIYFCRLTVGDAVATKKMMILK